MIANYHTHTFRCHHASGTDEDYVTSAIENGVKILGFSDHGCMIGPDYLKPDMRMRPELLPDYIYCLRKLREKYANQIEMHIGLEIEYYPEIFDDLIAFYRRNGLEYVLLGQHWIGKENTPGEGYRCFVPTDSEENLRVYTDTVIKGMETGLFTYLNHPDVIWYTGPDEIFEKYMRKIARRAKELGMVVEMNLHGLRGGRNYPDPRFFKIAGEEHCKVIIALDAHDPHEFYEHENEAKGLEMAREFGLDLVETVELVRL